MKQFPCPFLDYFQPIAANVTETEDLGKMQDVTLCAGKPLYEQVEKWAGIQLNLSLCTYEDYVGS